MKIIRRRVEDALRKGDWRQVQKTACLLGIGCQEEGGGHQFADHDCPICGAVFCFNCCGNSNRSSGGKHDPDFMFCPVCGHDIDA